MDHDKFFKLAKTLASKSTHNEQKHGCVIVYKGKVVSSGYNKAQTHPKSTHGFNNLHAEMSAIFKLERATSKHVAYVYREHRSGVKALSKPCQFCEKILRLTGIKTVYYTIEDGWTKETYG